MTSHCLESEFFGDRVGFIDIAQLPYSAFQNECSSANTNNAHKDSTGLRLYSGAHVAIRLMVFYSKLLEGRRIVELGCGVGALGLVGTSQCSSVESLVLTDGEGSTRDLVGANINNICKPDQIARVSYSELRWGDSEGIATLIAQQGGQHFDVAVGCELMYYRTDIAALLDTVLALTNSCGLFLHAHLFRREGQERELIDLLEARGWATCEVPHSRFVDATELGHHPEWYKVRALVSGPRARLEALVASDAACAHWRPFAEEYPPDDLTADEEEGAVGGLFQL